ncbi:MAG: methyltransferase family protein [Candidatus Thorarchaeota archaeon]|jgi:protein-S-isoprenylcysteine O-methyltransferase Ste14
MSEEKEDESSELPVDVKVLTLKEDWPLVPYITSVLIGVLLAIYDFVVWQQMVFQFNIFVILGVASLIVGGTMRSLPRRSLAAAGLGSIWNTPRLKIVKGHKLLTDGYYEYIRHPIYFGEIFRNYCIPLILSSFYGFAVMTVGIVFLLFRIHIEEKLLLKAFGEEYEEYRRRTKKLFPYIY